MLVFFALDQSAAAFQFLEYVGIHLHDVFASEELDMIAEDAVIVDVVQQAQAMVPCRIEVIDTMIRRGVHRTRAGFGRYIVTIDQQAIPVIQGVFEQLTVQIAAHGAVPTMTASLKP